MLMLTRISKATFYIRLTKNIVDLLLFLIITGSTYCIQGLHSEICCELRNVTTNQNIKLMCI